jgi:hypothetical protein
LSAVKLLDFKHDALASPLPFGPIPPSPGRNTNHQPLHRHSPAPGRTERFARSNHVFLLSYFANENAYFLKILKAFISIMNHISRAETVTYLIEHHSIIAPK